MLEQLPIRPETLTGDTGYSAGRLRERLEELGITAYIPIHPNQDNSVVAQRGFTFHGDHLVCPEGKVLRRRAFHRRATGGIEAISMWLVRRIASDVL